MSNNIIKFPGSGHPQSRSPGLADRLPDCAPFDPRKPVGKHHARGDLYVWTMDSLERHGIDWTANELIDVAKQILSNEAFLNSGAGAPDTLSTTTPPTGAPRRMSDEGDV